MFLSWGILQVPEFAKRRITDPIGNRFPPLQSNTSGFAQEWLFTSNESFRGRRYIMKTFREE